MQNKFEEAYLKIINESADKNVENKEKDTMDLLDDDEFKIITFKTKNKDLIEVLNNGFTKITFSVDDDNDADDTIEILPSSIIDLSIEEEDADENLIHEEDENDEDENLIDEEDEELTGDNEVNLDVSE
jgi:hypothetical protein